MRWVAGGVAMSLVLASGCGLLLDPSVPYRPGVGETRDAAGPPVDADVPPPDGMTPDDAIVMPSDGGSVDDAPMTATCSPECGDINADGMVDGADQDAWLPGSPCTNADLNADGKVDEEDYSILGGLVSGQVATACVGCDGRRCGDLDGDGTPSPADLSMLEDLQAGAPTDACHYLAGDVDRDGDISSADVTYLSNFLFAGGDLPCAP